MCKTHIAVFRRKLLYSACAVHTYSFAHTWQIVHKIGYVYATKMSCITVYIVQKKGSLQLEMVSQCVCNVTG